MYCVTLAMFESVLLHDFGITQVKDIGGVLRISDSALAGFASPV